MAAILSSPPDFKGDEDEFSIQIGEKIVPFFDTFVFLSSYRDERQKKDAIGPYWARIIGSSPTHIMVNFLGYGDEFNVFVHKEDLPELDYKFQLKGTPIYKNLDELRQGVKIILEAAEGKEISEEESRNQHNNNLFENYWKKQGSLTKDFKLSPEIINRLTVYEEWNSPTLPFFRESKGLGGQHPEMAGYKPPAGKGRDMVRGSRGQWKDVNVLGDGNCMFRAVANGLNFIKTGERWGFSNKDQDKLQADLRGEAVAWLCDPAHHDLPFATFVDHRTGHVHVVTVKGQIVDLAKESGFVEKKKEPLETAPQAEWDEYNKWTEKAISAYCKEKLKDGNKGRDYWGTDLELFALANIYGVGINVYHRGPGETINQSYDNYKRRFAPVGHGPLRGEVNIYWKGLNHYHVMYPNRT